MTMGGKTALVTGASSGIGLETARGLARLGAEVIMVCRDPFRGAAAAKDIASDAPGGTPIVITADLSSQRSIVELAQEVRARFDRVDVLIHNAGAVFSSRSTTVDGIERTLAVNHLAPFLLTRLLLDRVLLSPAGRILTVGSPSYASTLDFDNLQSEKGHHFFGAYLRTKLANLLFAFELARRLVDTAATSNCLSPPPSRTRFGENLTGASAWLPRAVKRIPFLLGTAAAGARTSIYLASSPEVDGVSGRFFMNGKPKSTKPVAGDREVARRLWEVSERLCAKSLA